MTQSVDLKGIKGKVQIAHNVYDFAKDGGTAGAYNLFDLKANTIVHNFWYEVETALTSGGLATVETGITGGDTDGFITQAPFSDLINDKLSADFEKGALLWNTTEDSNRKHKVTADSVVAFLIATASLTAGKVHFYCEYSDGY
jgi:hypothetical protein